jgi:hypothetical protein
MSVAAIAGGEPRAHRQAVRARLARFGDLNRKAVLDELRSVPREKAGAFHGAYGGAGKNSALSMPWPRSIFILPSSLPGPWRS